MSVARSSQPDGSATSCGTPVLLIHAAGLDLTYWDRQIAALAPDYDVIAFDLPGRGGTQGSPGDWTRESLSNFVADVVSTASVERTHPQVHGAMWDFVGGVDVEREPERVRCPTLVMVGDQDEVTPVEVAADLRDALPDARLRVIPNAAHVPPIERPDLVNECLRAFLATAA